MAFDQNSDLVLGEGLMLYVKTGSPSKLTPVAYATSHTLSVNGDTIDTSSKMSGNWQDFLVGQLNWQVTSESLISKTAGHMSYNTLFGLMVERKGIDIVIGTPTADDEDFVLDTTKPMMKGQAVITSLEQTANRGEVCTSSCTLQGKGELVIVTDDD
jgi:TP901-1 family phage major tail protein